MRGFPNMESLIPTGGVSGILTLPQRLSGHLFWDVSISAIDEVSHRDWLIVRVMDRGTREDVRHAWNHYGSSKVRESLLKAPSLRLKTIAFFASQFELPRESFRAWRNRDSDWEG